MITAIERSAVGIVGAATTVTLFATDTVIPGWSDVGEMAKVSILAALFSILSIVISFVIWSLFSYMRELQKDHMAELNNSRTALMGEIKDSRDAFGHVITNIRDSAERQATQGATVLTSLNETLRQMSAGCAAVHQQVLQDAADARIILQEEAARSKIHLKDDAATARDVIHEAAGVAHTIVADEASVVRGHLHDGETPQ